MIGQRDACRKTGGGGGGGRRRCWQALLLVLLTLPLITHEFSFGFGDETDADGEDASVSAGARQAAGGDVGERSLAKRRAIEKKFKFHKIERVYVDDYVEDANDAGEDDDDADEADGEDNNGPGQRIALRESGETDDDEDARSSRINKDEEFQFERAHRAEKDRRQGTKSKATADAELADVAGGSWLPTFWPNFFGGNDEGKMKTRRAVNDEAERSNNIIDWIKWLGERAGRMPAPKEVPVATVAASESWLAYLNRWPFNSIFPFGQQAKPIGMPRRGRRGGAGEDDSSDATLSGVQPMSQEHFESLLHTLPGFVTNASHVADAECRQQLQIFHRQLRAYKLWTLQMLDATGKITSGILRGNINQFGDFDLCTQVRTLVKVTPERPVRIRGKYCLAQIETQTDSAGLKVPLHLAHGRGLWNGHLGNPNHFVPRYTVANWGVCIPHACSAAVVHEMLQTNLRPYNSTGVEFHIEVHEDNCVMQRSRRILRILKKDAKFDATLLYMAALFLLGLIALLWEHWTWLSQQVQKLRKREAATAEAPAVSVAEQSETQEIPEEKNEEREEIKDEEDAAATDEAPDPAQDATKSIESDEPTEAAIDVNNSFRLLLLEFLRAFSPQQSLQTLISREGLDVEFPIFHVLKLGATFMLYVCLKYLMLGHLPLSNREALVHAVDKPWSVLFRAPLIYSDTLLLLSGFLVAYQLSEEMEEKHYIQVLKRVASKATSYLPTMYVMLSFQTWMLPHLGAGPLWNQLIGENSRLCEKQMWRNAFSVQNAIDVEETCSPLTLQLALNVQLYLLGPLIVWLYYTDADAAFFTYGAFQAMSIAMRFARTNVEHLSLTLFHGMNVSKFYRTANLIYGSPISRATPYLLGIAAGLVYRSERELLEITGRYLPLGWAVALLSIVWCFWSPASGMRTDFIYAASDAAAYAAWSPLVLGLALCWCILMFPRGEGSVWRFLTSSRPVLVLSRLTYPLQLAMYVVVLWNTASIKETIKYQLNDLLNFQEIGSIICLAAIVAIVIDVPAQRVRHLLINRLFKERPLGDAEQEPVSGAEPSEGEQSEGASEHMTSDTPEPTETIWASDPEEEEQKYIARRRSSVIDDDVANVVGKKDEAATKPTHDIEAEEDEEEEDTEIEEAAEVKRRPDTPPPPQPAVKKEATPPPPAPKAALPYTRRRRPTSDD